MSPIFRDYFNFGNASSRKINFQWKFVSFSRGCNRVISMNKNPSILGKHPYILGGSIGNASSKHQFSGDMFVFMGVYILLDPIQKKIWSHFCRVKNPEVFYLKVSTSMNLHHDRWMCPCPWKWLRPEVRFRGKSSGIFCCKDLGWKIPFVCWQVVLEVVIFLMEMMFRWRKRLQSVITVNQW